MGTTTRRELMALGEVIELGTLHVTFLDRRDGVDLGDSGGTWTEAGRDRDGPIIAVTSLIVPALSIGTETFLWAGVSPGIGRNVDWIWATIAETPGTCVLGPRSPTPGAPEPDCVVAGEVMPDTDGDGLPDEHDLCPRLDGRNTIRAPRTTDTAGGVTGQHQDDDGAFVIDFVGDDCDPYPTLCDWTDRDDDTVPDSVDNCPDEPNRSQENCGGDPRGDACEDDDADGRTDSCGLDNCPPDPARPDVATYNPDQLNCNEDAELAIGTVARGDACDAVPCADTVLQTRDIAGGPGAPAMRVQDQVWIDGVSTVPQDARAGMRFCACPGAASNDVETRQRCGRVVGCRISAGPYTEIETPLQPWRHTTLDYGSGDSGPPIALFVSANEAATSYAPAAGPFRRDLVATWRQEIDFARWSPIYGSPASTDAPGVVWTHTPGGSDAALFAPAVRALSSHYWSGDVAPPHRLVPAAPFPGPFIAAFLGPDVCLECDSSFPAAFITIDSVGDPWVDVRGSLVPVSVAFGGLPIGDPTLQWVASAEPDEWLDTARLRYVALDPGGKLVHAAVQTATGFAELGACGPNGCPSPCDNPAGCGASARTSASTAPPPEVGVPVLSATESTLFVVGATDGPSPRSVTATSIPATTITTLDLGAFVLGRVLAATYSPSLRALYVVDLVGHRERDTRLSLISVSGTATELARWHRLARTTRLAVAEAPDATLYLVASGERGGHIVLRIDPRLTPPRILGAARGHGVLGAPMIRASRLGVSLIATDERQAGPLGYLGSAFRPSRARDADECF